jgi:Bacterial Ig-like domain (group 3)
VEVPADGGPQTLVDLDLDQPWGVAIDGAGDLFVTESAGTDVVKISARGENLTKVGSGLSGTTGVAVDGAGNVFISDQGNNNLVEVPANGGAQITLATGLNNPLGIAVNGVGDVFIANAGGKVVDEVVPGNQMPLVWGGGFVEPEGVAVDAAGDVFVADEANGNLMEVPAVGGAPILVGSRSFSQLAGVAVDGAGDLFVADYATGRVTELPYSQPPSLVFSSTGAEQTVTLENIGNLPLVLPGIAQGTNPIVSNGSFVLDTTSSTSCAVVTASASTPGTLGPGHTCDLAITFSPTDGGTQSGTLVLTDNSLNASPSAFTSQTITLSGTATANLPDISWGTPAAITFGTALSTTQLNATANTAGTFSYNPPAGTALGAGAHTLSVTFTPNDKTDFTAASTTVTLIVTKAVLPITWATPAAITYGSALSATQLAATSPVAGKFVYSPPAGTGLTAGSQTLSVTFTPTDTTDYTTATASVSLTVNKAATTTKVVSSLNPSVANQSVTFTATVNSQFTGATGTVSFKDGSTVLGSGPLNSSGVATYSTSSLAGGAHTITAAYSGDGDDSASTTAALTQTVEPAPTLTSPAPGSVLAGASVNFKWTPETGSAGYWLFLGTTGVGSKNLYDSGEQAATSATFSSLPTNGETIYARVYAIYNGTLVYNDYTYIAWMQPPVLTSPTPGSTLVGPSVTFTWTAATGPANQGYWLFLGTTGAGSKDLYDSGQQTATSATFKSLPNNGETIYARVYMKFNGTLIFNDYTYSTVSQAVLISPTPGSTFTSTSETFTWTSASPGNQGYWLFLGTTGVGSKNLYDSGQQTATSATFKSLPTNGATIYARVYTDFNGTLVYNDYTYKAQ